VEEARENQFFEKLRGTLEAARFKKQDRMVDRLLEQGYASTDIAAALIHMLQGGEGDGSATAASTEKKGVPKAAAASDPGPKTQPPKKKKVTIASISPEPAPSPRKS